MDNKRVIIIIVFFALVLSLILFFSQSKTAYNWRETYKEGSKDPYGTHVINQLLQSYFPNEEFHQLQDSIYGILPDTIIRNGNYVFIGEGLFLDSLDVETLLRFVANGNRAFISSKTIPFDLMFYLYYEECNEYYWNDYVNISDTIAHLNLIHPNLETKQSFIFKYLYRNKPKPYRWQFIEEYYFCEEDFSPVALGYMNDTLVNFARFPYGEGAVYLHTAPIAFSNIQLLEKEHLNYANKVFSHLQTGPIYWDEYSRISELIGRRRNERNRNNTPRTLSSESPLQYILSQPPLAWAWYLLLGISLLFLLFRTKRKQRIIPVSEQNTNTSLEFLSTIGRLYFLQNNHKQLSLQKMKLFLGQVRDRYHLQTRSLDDNFVEQLSIKSEVSEEIIQKILLLYKNISNSSFVSENTLIEFHQVVDQFYKNRK